VAKKLDRNKVLAQAQKFIQKGDIAKAIDAYERLLKAQPKDVQSLLRVAGLYLRAKRTEDAVQTYLRAGQEYTNTGFYQKAVAAYKQAMQQRPDDANILSELGALYQKMGLKSPAVEHYGKAAQAFAADRNYDAAIEAMQVVTDLEPDRPELKARYGEYLYQAGREEEAISVFRGLVEILKLEGQWEDLARFYERILQMNPDDVEIGKDLARTYLRLGLAPKALKQLKHLFDTGTRDAEIFDLLARGYVLLGKNDKAVGAYLEKIKRMPANRYADEIEKTYRRILEIDPTNETALEALGDAEQTEAEGDDLLDGEIDPDAAEAEADDAVDVVSVDQEAAPAARQPNESAGSEFSEILQEASVYIRYGIREKALAKLEQILAQDANNIIALKKHAEVLRDNDPQRAAADLVKLSEIHEGLGDLDQADQFIEQAKKLAPDSPAVQTYLGDDEEDAVLGGEDVAEAEPQSSEDEVVLAEQEDISEDADDTTVVDVGADDGIPEVEVETVEAETASNADTDDAQPPYQDEIDQIQFFLETGLADEARQLLADLKERYGTQPEFAALESKLAAADADEGEELSADDVLADDDEAPDDAAADGGIFDLAKELEDELDFDVEETSPGAEDVPSFDEIFDAFKQGVKEQIDDEDADAHYDLGIAYLEMELLNDAVAEFELAAASSAKEADAYNMIAVAKQRQGDQEGAVAAYKNGLEVAEASDSVRLNMHYELALVYEELGQFREALKQFKEVVGIDRNYRDVTTCLKRMREKIESLKSKAAEKGNVAQL